MANNINVLEVLESKPNGTKLWCVLFGKCFLDGIDINNIRPIRIGIEKGQELFIKNLIKTNNFYHFLFNLIFIYRKGLYTPQLIYDITSN